MRYLLTVWAVASLSTASGAAEWIVDLDPEGGGDFTDIQAALMAAAW